MFPFSFFLVLCRPLSFYFFFFNDTATTEIYTLSLHDALPISFWCGSFNRSSRSPSSCMTSSVEGWIVSPRKSRRRSEEHTSELQSPCNLVCRLLLEKKKNENMEYLDVTT